MSGQMGHKDSNMIRSPEVGVVLSRCRCIRNVKSQEMLCKADENIVIGALDWRAISFST
jgi:hypothetical protein